MAAPNEPGPADAQRELLARCIEAAAAGGLPAAEALLAASPTDPATATAVRDRLHKLARAGLLATPAAPTADATPERLGEYRLLRRLGAGGMGVVHLAEQESLKRTVALKLLRPEQRFFPGARERFQREIEVIARLGDPGIVPIYAVGEEQGVDFFTMEYVRGASLADLVADLHDRPPETLSGADLLAVAAHRAGQAVPAPAPELFAGSYVATCCRIATRMALAAQHAHERGVVHRDLKPSNAMVTPDGRVLLLDFGLAAATGTARITRSGAELGTLHYMAPEQLLDGTIDARTDVYALGVTLHELLALRPPFHADSAERLRASILRHVVPDLRLANPEVPIDVRTIVGRAMERDAARRYPSARELALDLERFLAHRPIVARPASWLHKSRRWCQRHPTAATAIALLLLTGGLLPVVATLVQREAERGRQAAEATARANLQEAVEAIRAMAAQAQNATFEDTPGLDPIRLQQLDAAAARIDELHRHNPDDPFVQRLYAHGLLQAAKVRIQLGQAQRALTVLDTMQPLLAARRATAPDDQALWIDHCAAMSVRGAALADLGRFTEATAAWTALLQEFDGQDLLSLPRILRVTASTCLNNLARDADANGDHARAITLLERALPIDLAVLAEDPTPHIRLDHVRMRLNLGTFRLQRGDFAGAQSEYEAAMVQVEALRSAGNPGPEARREWARVHFCLSNLASKQKDLAKAREHRDLALPVFRDLAKSFADRVGYLQDLAQAAFQASCDLQNGGEPAAAVPLADEAVTSQAALLQKHPGAADVQSDLATYLRHRAGLHLVHGDPTTAVTTLERSLVLQREVVELRPNDPRYRMVLGGLEQELGIFHWRQQQWRPARDAWRRAVAVYDAALATGDRQALEPKRLPLLLQVLAQAEHLCDDQPAVVATLRRLQELRPMPASTLRDIGEQLHLTERADFRALLDAAPRDDK